MLSRFEYEQIFELRKSLITLSCDLHRATTEFVGRKYRPDQPRVPAGTREGGQWTLGGIGTGGDEARTISDAAPDESWISGAQYAAGPRLPKDRLPLHLPHRSADGSAGSYIYRAGQVTIVNNAQTGISTVDETTEKLVKVLESVVSSQPEGFGAQYGTKIHNDFAAAVRAESMRGIGVKGVEQTYGPDPNSRYGAKDSIRTDVVLRNDVGDPIAIYDVKTGGAKLERGRVRELREKTGATLSVPVIEMHITRGLSLKARAKSRWLIALILWNPWVRQRENS